MDAAVGGEIDFGPSARAGNPDLGETAVFFQPRAALCVERALVWKQSFLPARQEYVVEFEALGGMQRHNRHRILVRAAFAVHLQRDVFEKAEQVLEFLHRAHKLFQVFQPARAGIETDELKPKARGSLRDLIASFDRWTLQR